MDMKLWNKKKDDSGVPPERDWFSLFSMIVAFLVILFIGSAILAILFGGMQNFHQTIQSREILFALRLSLLTSSISTVLVMLFALPTAYALTRTRMPGKHIWELLIELTLSLPYLLLGLSLLILFSSPFGKWLKSIGFQVVFAPAGIVMAHLLINLPYAVRMIKTAFAGSDERLEYIARTLGASRFRAFLTVLLPMCRSSLISTFILTWSRAMGEFGGTLMLVGITRMKTETLPGSIYLSISTGNTTTAMATAMLMLILSGAAMFLSHLAEKADKTCERKVS